MYVYFSLKIFWTIALGYYGRYFFSYKPKFFFYTFILHLFSTKKYLLFSFFFGHTFDENEFILNCCSKSTMYIYKECRTIWKRDQKVIYKSQNLFHKMHVFSEYFYYYYFFKSIFYYLLYLIHCELQTQYHQLKDGSGPHSKFGQ